MAGRLNYQVAYWHKQVVVEVFGPNTEELCVMLRFASDLFQYPVISDMT